MPSLWDYIYNTDGSKKYIGIRVAVLRINPIFIIAACIVPTDGAGCNAETLSEDSLHYFIEVGHFVKQ